MPCMYAGRSSWKPGRGCDDTADAEVGPARSPTTRPMAEARTTAAAQPRSAAWAASGAGGWGAAAPIGGLRGTGAAGALKAAAGAATARTSNATRAWRDIALAGRGTPRGPEGKALDGLGA